MSCVVLKKSQKHTQHQFNISVLALGKLLSIPSILCFYILINGRLLEIVLHLDHGLSRELINRRLTGVCSKFNLPCCTFKRVVHFL